MTSAKRFRNNTAIQSKRTPIHADNDNLSRKFDNTEIQIGIDPELFNPSEFDRLHSHDKPKCKPRKKLQNQWDLLRIAP